MFKKMFLSIIISISAFSANAEITTQQINIQCLPSADVVKYMSIKKAKILGYTDFKTDSGHSATDYVANVDGKIVIVRTVSEAGLSCVLGEVPLNLINQNSKGSV